MLNALCKPLDSVRQRLCANRFMLHDRKALLRQPVKLLHARGMLRCVQSVDRAICSVCSGLRGIRMRSRPRCLRGSSRFRRHQRKGKELHMPLCRNLIVELAH